MIIVATVIARRITDVNNLGRNVIDLHIGDVVVRIGSGDLVYRVRNVGGDGPRSGCAVGDIPDAIVTGVEEIAVAEHRSAGVLRV